MDGTTNEENEMRITKLRTATEGRSATYGVLIDGEIAATIEQRPLRYGEGARDEARWSISAQGRWVIHCDWTGYRHTFTLRRLRRNLNDGLVKLVPFES